MLTVAPWLAVVMLSLDSRPPLADVERLPDRSTLRAMLALNRLYRDELGKRFDFDVGDVAQARFETLQCEGWLQMMADIRDAERWNTESARDLLSSLRDAIGMRRYYSGDWPPAIPWWRLPRADMPN